MLHFSDSDFTFNKRNLIKNAIPKMFKIENCTMKVLTPKKTYSSKHFPKSPEPSTLFQPKISKINAPETSPTSHKKSHSKIDDGFYIPTPKKSVKNPTSTSYLLTPSPGSTPNTKSIMHVPSPSIISPKVLFPRNTRNIKHNNNINNKVLQLKKVVENQGKLLNYKRASISKLRNNLSILK